MAMRRSWIALSSFCGSGLSKDVAVRDRKRPESELSLEKKKLKRVRQLQTDFSVTG